MTTRSTRISLLLIIVLAAALRVWHIGWGLPNGLHRWPYHPDEANTLLSLRSMDAAGHFTDGFSWGSFYLYLVGAALKVSSMLGIFILSPSQDFYAHHISELARIYLTGRAISVFWGVMAVYLMYLLGRLISGAKTGLVSALFTAIMPFAVISSHFMTPHVQFASLALLALILGVKIETSDRFVWYALFGISAGLAIGTYWFFGFILFVFLFLVHMSRSKDRPGRLDLRSLFDKRIIATGLITIATLFAVAPHIFYHWKTFFLYWQSAAMNATKPVPGVLYPLFHILPYGLGGGLFTVSLFGIIWAFRKRKPLDISFVIWMAAYYFTVTFTGSYQWVRRFAPLPYAMVIVGAKFMVEAWDEVKGRVLFRAGMIFLGAAIFLSTLFLSLAELNLMAFDTRDMAYPWLVAHLPAGSSIGIRNWYHIPHIDVKRYKVTVVPDIGVEGFKSGNLDYYLISDLDADIGRLSREAKGYLLVKSFGNPPAFLGFRFNDTLAPEDMRFTNPEIYLFERRAEVRP